MLLQQQLASYHLKKKKKKEKLFMFQDLSNQLNTC